MTKWEKVKQKGDFRKKHPETAMSFRNSLVKRAKQKSCIVNLNLVFLQILRQRFFLFVIKPTKMDLILKKILG